MPRILPKSFYYLRHGQTDWNLQNKAMGITDIPLNQQGIEQAKKARHLLANAQIDTICYSPLLRSKLTAEIFNEILNCKMIAIDELKEFNLGIYAGTIIDDWFHEWLNGAALPEGELFVDFKSRCIRGINKALDRPGLTLIIAHGGVFWSLEDALQVKLGVDLPNCVPAFLNPPTEQTTNWEISLTG
jgi:probable phosphoglycerate mutase